MTSPNTLGQPNRAVLPLFVTSELDEIENLFDEFGESRAISVWIGESRHDLFAEIHRAVDGFVPSVTQVRHQRDGFILRLWSWWCFSFRLRVRQDRRGLIRPSAGWSRSQLGSDIE